MSLRPLAGVALVGTGRADALNVPELSEGVLGDVGGLTDDANRALLAVAGTLALKTRVGTNPKRLAAAPVAAPPQAAPVPSPQASRLLAAMLDGRHGDLLREYLLLLHQKNGRVPEVYLPALLTRGAKLFSLRPYILSVLGEPGRWLATQNEAWHYASPVAGEWAGMLAEWRTKVMSARQGILFQARYSDPEAGLALLESSWKSEGVAASVWIIRGLAVGLSLTDEPFLERALDNRNATVRLKAAELLASLPDSRLCQRMTQNSAGVLRYRAGAGRFDIHLKEPSAEMARDGVVGRNWRDAARVRSAQLSDIVGAVPLDVWTGRWNLTPQEVVSAAKASRWHAALLKGFALAALRQRHANFSEALLKADHIGVNTIKLVPQLPPASHMRLVKHFSTEELGKTNPLAKLYSRWAGGWSPELAELWLGEARATHGG